MVWFDDDSDDDEDTTVKGSQVESAVARLYAVFILMWQTLFKVSNSGINIIFIFFAKLLSLLAVLLFLQCFSASLKELAQKIPKNVGQAKSLIGQEKDSFSKCPRCHTTYALNVCTVTLPNKTKESKRCSYVKYPHHPHTRHSTEKSLQ